LIHQNLVKRTALAVGLVLLLQGVGAKDKDVLPVLSPEAVQTSVGSYVYLDILLGSGAHLNGDSALKLADVSENMDPFFRQSLYTRYKKNIFAAAITNGLTGGMGSLLEGDWIVGSVLTLAGLSSLTYSVALFAGMPSDETLTAIATYTGFGLTAFGITWPIITGLGPNKKLRTALSLP